MQTSAPATGRVVHQVRLFFIAVQFFTRLPIPRWVGFEVDWLHQASRYFPAVGVVVGVAVSAVYALAQMVWPPVVAVLLSMAAGIYLTGAFHEDGFADACDGLGGGVTKQRVLEIMTDSRIGAYGAIGIGLLLGLKCATLSGLPVQVAIGSLLLAHPLSRLAATVLIWKLDYVKQEGKSKPLAQRMSNFEFAIASVTVLAVLMVIVSTGLLSWSALAAGTALAALSAGWLARKCIRRLGGYTGDCLGAIQQLSEVAFYLGVLAVAAP
ncbi:adenosylcobinamide-GDP ribazoletransferase [Noviherbaspirillum sp. ST9]|uniref:adenosylcobinamide-GDP ribazoletransferase n=1 Tax=Noviherbaspirillum sp. ST9 TaxID=3401606 RepID=UPI003B58975A